MKKQLYFFGILLTAAISLAACGSDDNDNYNKPVDQGDNIKKGNLQFPAPKGGSSIIVNHYAPLSGNSGNLLNYSVEWDTEKNAQRWSCFKYYRSISGSSVNRYSASNDGSLSPTCQYPNDQDIPEQYRMTEDPYKSSGYDHGHICASADRQRSTDANYQTFYITNMQPQGNNFNANIWASMEKQVRDWYSKFDTLYICKGGTIDKAENIIEYVFQRSHQSTRVNAKHIPVPKYFFMAVLGRTKNNFKATGFWINQTSYSSNTPKSYAVTIGELQNLTGIDFFCNLPDDIENKVENVSRTEMLSDWY